MISIKEIKRMGFWKRLRFLHGFDKGLEILSG
jgi:hypothetical protein